MGKEQGAPPAHTISEPGSLTPEPSRSGSRLRPHLLTGALVYYDHLSPFNQQWYERELSRVQRMELIREEGFLAAHPEHSETDLDHYIESLDMASEYKAHYPALEIAGINWDMVHIFTTSHDCGELADKVGDVRPVKRTRKDEARKRLEPKAARIAILSMIPDPIFRRDVSEDYNYYVNYAKNRIKGAPIDINVEMARFIDKAQGIARSAEIAFNVGTVDFETAQRMAVHLLGTENDVGTVRGMIDPALELIAALPTHEARQAMKEILKGELELIGKFAPSQVYEANKFHVA